ncbi:SMI1/KNR4 family protein [Actinomyces israelii]|uniref:SMI1/KNR4 family protein n=1 Tax=Actinomyces israelii TaxID=1659 RepID=UPI0025540F0B|nr:SMI1/KNR4 family protein [Actinomyces israelii]WKR20407.1 hypothetical protein AIF0345_0284 [Actinomyces israelii]
MGETSHDNDLMARLGRISAGITQLPCPKPEPPSPELKLIRRLLEVPEEPEPHWGPPLSDAELAECEQCLGVSLPEDYRAFLTRVTRGGDWPFCLVWEPGEGSSEFGGGLRPDLPFPYTDSDPLVIAESNRQEYEEQLSSGAVNHGFVPLSTDGCGMNYILVVTAADPSAIGTVWAHDLPDDLGIQPLHDPGTGRPLRFLEWMERSMERCRALLEDGEDLYFLHTFARRPM